MKDLLYHNITHSYPSESVPTTEANLIKQFTREKVDAIRDDDLEANPSLHSQSKENITPINSPITNSHRSHHLLEIKEIMLGHTVALTLVPVVNKTRDSPSENTVPPEDNVFSNKPLEHTKASTINNTLEQPKIYLPSQKNQNPTLIIRPKVEMHSKALMKY